MTEQPDTETIGMRIRRLRVERGLSLREVAGPGVSYTYLSRVETGHRMPSVRAIRSIARKLGVTPELLETGIELHAREELELALSDLELAVRLESQRTDAEMGFQRIIERADAEGADYLALRARASLGMALAAWGRHDEAATLLELALANPAATPNVFTEAFVTLALAYKATGREADAADVCERALRNTPPEDEAARVVLATYLSYALADIGDFEQAHAVLEELSTHAEDADPYTRARVHWTRARVEAMEGKQRVALHHMRKAITLLEGTEDTLLVARAHLLSGQILLWGGTTTGVEGHLSAARALLPAQAGPDDRCWTHALQALLAAREGRWADASRLADRAAAVHAPGHAVAAYAKALSLAHAGDFAGADSAFASALASLEKMKLWREAEMVARDRARAARASGDLDNLEHWSRQADDFAARAAAKNARRRVPAPR